MDTPTYIAVLIPSLALLVSIIAVWLKAPEKKLHALLNVLLCCIFVVGIVIVIFISYRYFAIGKELSGDTANSQIRNTTASVTQSSTENTNTSTSVDTDSENEKNGDYNPITYNDGKSKHLLSGDIIHFPDVARGDYIVGGIWSLQPDFTGADPYVLVHSDGYTVIRTKTGNDVICKGKIQFGTAWSEDALGNWDEKYETYNSPFTNMQMPTESYGTFTADLSQYLGEITPGEYTCQICISLNGGEYTTEIAFEIDW